MHQTIQDKIISSTGSRYESRNFHFSSAVSIDPYDIRYNLNRYPNFTRKLATKAPQ